MTDPGSPLFDFVRIMAILGGILLLAWTGVRYWLAPRLQGGGGKLRPDVVEVLSRQPLDSRNTLYVVRAGNDHLLLSASDTTGVTLLRELRLEPASETVETPATALMDAPQPSFAGVLRKLRQKVASS